MGKQRNNSSDTRKYTLLYIIAALTAVTHLCGCDNRRVYSHYEHLDLNGWERNDTAFFGFRCHESGTYSLDMGFRTNHDFPYKSLSMVVEHIIFPSHSTGHSTIRCRITDDAGNITGKQGISCNDIKYHLGEIEMQKDDSIKIKINHCMRREMLPGLSEIGIEAIKLR